MPVTAAIGAQWGDEGKGKVVDRLAAEADIVVRFSGGNNAGHTVINERGKFALHLVPAGIFYPHVVNVVGNGVMVNPEALVEEIEGLEKAGIDVGKLVISPRAHLVMPWHILQDAAIERGRGENAIGTTGRGIGPACADRALRISLRMADLVDDERLEAGLRLNLQLKNPVVTGVWQAPAYELEPLYERYRALGRRLRPMVQEAYPLLRQAAADGKRILFEGAHGVMLDPDFGTYPYVTSTPPGVSGIAQGSGLGATDLDRVVGIVKAYTTRVGAGPLPTELHGQTAEDLREAGDEYGTTTGRPRRCGWFDAPVVRYAAQLNGFTELAITKLDVLDSLRTIRICTDYTIDGKDVAFPPGESQLLARCTPVYEEMAGWQSPISALSTYAALPPQAKAYLVRLEELVGVPINLVSVGPRREQMVWK